MISSFSSIWPVRRTLSGSTTPGQSGPGSDGKERVRCNPKISSIIGTSTSDFLVSNPGYLSEEGSYPFAEKQSVYSTDAPAGWAMFELKFNKERG